MAPEYTRWHGIKPVSSVASGLDVIARQDKSFNAEHFVSGAETAYEMIVLAYAQGDRRKNQAAQGAVLSGTARYRVRAEDGGGSVRLPRGPQSS
jgi:predicted lipid-binding transport protein (Tim44 family)